MGGGGTNIEGRHFARAGGGERGGCGLWGGLRPCCWLAGRSAGKPALGAAQEFRGAFVLYNYSVRLHKTANFQRWIIFITAVSRMIAGFFSVVNFRQIYILLNVWRRNFQFVNITRISMQHGAVRAAGAIECHGARAGGCCGQGRLQPSE